jgi:uncharacterized membrane protein
MTPEPVALLLQIQFPHDIRTNIMIVLRSIHFLAGITWIGLLYFFNLVNVPFLQGLEGSTRSRIYGPLMSRALWWFRWGAVVTVLVGFGYWNMIVAADARNAGMSGGHAIWSFIVIWTVAFLIEMGMLMSPLEVLRKGPVLGVVMAVVIFLAGWAFVDMNSHGWESNRLLSIGIGGGIGWFMMFNVWGLIWRMQKRMIVWMEQNALNGTPLPDKAAQYARLTFLASRLNFWLSFPMLFFMGAASHYTMFTGMR